MEQSGQARTWTAEEIEEIRKIRKLQLLINLVMQEIATSPELTVEQASEMVANARRTALAMFPGKELAFDLLYRPRLQRMMNERFRIQ